MTIAKPVNIERPISRRRSRRNTKRTLQKNRRERDIFEYLLVVRIMLMFVRYIKPRLGKIHVLPYRSLKSSWSGEMA